MKNNYLTVVACLILFCTGLNSALSQNLLQFLDCASDSVSLCVSDEGVSLPANNKVYLGEGHPDATSCSAHLSQTARVTSFCTGPLQYEVRLYLYDTSAPIILKSVTSVEMDSLSVAELSFDSELSPDSVISQNGIPYTTGCYRYHRIEWIVTDSCGEQAVCEKMIELYDCFKPIYNPPHSPQTITSWSSLVTLYTSDIPIELQDDCTGNNDFLISFNPEFYAPDSLVDFCDAPGWGIIFPFDFWIADGGRDLNCNGSIEWNERRLEKEHINLIFIDNQGTIECYDFYALSGKIKTPLGQPITDVEVTLSTFGHIFPTYVTAEDGLYKYNIEDFGFTNIAIHVERNDNHKNGVTTLDLVRIMKHLLRIDTLNNPYDLIAADANNSQFVSVFDLIEIRRLILGINSELPNNLSWRFVPEDSIFSDPTHPWPFAEETLIPEMTSDRIQNFIGIKIGDVNNTAIPDATSIQVRSQDLFALSSNDQEYKAGQSVEIKFTTKELKTLQGFQFTLSSPDLIFESAHSENINISDDNYASFVDKMTFSWYQDEVEMQNEDDVILTVISKANKSGSLANSLVINSEITEAEVYTSGDKISQPILTIVKPERENIGLFSPQPNPWKENTEIPFYIDQPGEIAFQIFDLHGRTIYSTSANYQRGYHVIKINSSEFEGRGLLLYTLQTAEGISSGKMVVLDK